MHDIGAYRIGVKGEVDEAALNASSPINVRAERMKAGTTPLAIHADQSGLIGLLRHLHQQGFVLFSVFRDRQNIVREEQNEDSNNSQ